MREPFMPASSRLKTKTRVSEVSRTKNLPFKLTALPMAHIVPTCGYRIETDKKTLAYALDGGVSANAVKLAKNADLLITECSYLPGQSPDNNHLNPEQAAETAARAQARLLALIHFKADTYNNLQKRDCAMAAAGALFTHTIAPYDGDHIQI
jgi:ribonuclease BN (tRNA processing enzyme)